MQNAKRGESQDVLGLVADILRAPPRYETAVQAVLGDRLQSVVVRSQGTGLASIETLKSEAVGRSSFIPLALRKGATRTDAATVHGPGVIGPMLSLLAFEPAYEPVARYLLDDVVLVEDLSSALSVWTANGHKATLVTLEGDVLEPEGVLTGGSLEGLGTHLLQHKREIRELQDKLQELDAGYRLALDAQGTIKAQIAALGSSIDSLRQNSHEEEIRILDQEKDLTHLSDDLQRIGGRLEELVRECARLQAEVDECRREKERVHGIAEESARGQAELESRIREGRATLDDEKRKLAALNQEVLDLKVQAAASAERADAARRALEGLTRSRQDLEHRLERLRAEVSASNIQAVQGRQRIEESRQEISKQLARREELQARLGTSREAYEKLLAQVREEELKVKEARHQLDQVVSGLGDTNLQVQKIDLDLSHLIEEVRRAHKLELGECLSQYHLCPPPSEADLAKAAKLRVALERMGDVNPNAVEAYEELKQRYEFLTTQGQDLTDSLDKLTKVIQKINRASRKRFRDAFDAINSKFQEVFPRLFNGGRAHLILDETQDLLEAGVDIAAQPPGKKLQNIELLSGGEKALTAVALLFSIFLVKPTPFCLLDEVDAPLDDVNIDRFNAMVKEMSKGSQFILITHNKRTMELLDRLYGVTMEEPGISNIVNVQLKARQGGSVEQAA
jgi:chromosome segregation protein